MKDYAIAFLAFGEEHINEFNLTIQDLLKLDNNINIFVYTDDKSLIENKDIHIRESKEPFNYNLKRRSFEFAFEHHNIVVFMDTDVVLPYKLDFDYIETVDEGMYVRWIEGETLYGDRIISIDDVLQTEYGELIGDKDLRFFNEFLMVLRIDDIENRKLFIKTWDELNDKTLAHQPNNGYDGSLECLIIHAACNKLGIKVEKSVDPFFRGILNAGTLNQISKRKITKSII